VLTRVQILLHVPPPAIPLLDEVHEEPPDGVAAAKYRLGEDAGVRRREDELDVGGVELQDAIDVRVRVPQLEGLAAARDVFRFHRTKVGTSGHG
jgi:hypothetical protein